MATLTESPVEIKPVSRYVPLPPSREFLKEVANDEIINKLVDFLDPLRTKSDDATHTFAKWSHNGRVVVGKFKVKPEDREHLISLVSAAVATGRSIPLTEKLGDIAPLRVDIDLRQTEVIDTITKDYVDKLVKAIGMEGTCYVMTKPARKAKVGAKDVVKHGIHLHYPDILVDKEKSKEIRDRVIKELGEGLYPDFECVEKTPLTDVYDIASTGNNWFMYGCRKEEENASWTATRAVKVVGGDIVDDVIPEGDLVSMFSVLEDATWEHKTKFITEPQEPEPETRATGAPKSATDTPDNMSVQSVKILVDMLDPSRADDYNKWRDVCFSVFGIRNKYRLNEDEIDDILHDFSAKSEKYNRKVVREKLRGFEKDKEGSRYGIPYLKNAAKEDNPDAFAEAMGLRVNDAIYDDDKNAHEITLEQMLECGETDGVVEILNRITGGRFKAIPIGGGQYEFYYHNGVYWEPDNDIKTTSVHIYIKKIKEAIIRASNNLKENSLNSLEFEDNKKTLAKNAKKLSGHTYQKLCAEAFLKEINDTSFRKKLNLINPHLLVFTNGVYDLDAGEFRDGRPDDYISFTTGYDYNEQKDGVIIDKIRTVFRDIFPTEGEYQYFVSCVSLFLHGNRGRTNNNLLWLYGEQGSNGKSTIVTLLRNMFGDYAMPLSSSVYTNVEFQKDANAPCPALAGSRGKRFAALSEIQDGSTLYSGMMKQLTSGTDEITPLDKFETGARGISFVPQFGQIAYSNVFPKLKASSSDGGVSRRLNTLKLIYEFVDTPTEPNHKQKDITLMSLFATDKYKQQMFLFFLDEYNKVKDLTGVPKPKEVDAANQELADEHNPIANFLEEYVEKVDTPESDGRLPHVSSSALLAAFNNSPFGIGNRMDAKKLKKELEPRGITSFKITSGKEKGTMGYSGIRLRDISSSYL